MRIMIYSGHCISEMHQTHCNCHKGAQNQGLAVHVCFRYWGFNRFVWSADWLATVVCLERIGNNYYRSFVFLFYIHMLSAQTQMRKLNRVKKPETAEKYNKKATIEAGLRCQANRPTGQPQWR